MQIDGMAPAVGEAGASLFRSQPMDFVRMVFPKEASHLTVSKFGHMSQVQFVDLNEDKPATQREHSAVLQRCSEVARVLRVFQELSEEHKLSPIAAQPSINFTSTPASPKTIEELEKVVQSQEQYLAQLNTNTKSLVENRWLCQENIWALEKAAPYFNQTAAGGAGGSISAGLLGDGGGGEMHLVSDGGGTLTNVVGVIAEDKTQTFEKILYRATRGNTVVKFEELPHPVWDAVEGKEVTKKVFVAFLQGMATYDKVKRICDVVGAHVYDYNTGELHSRTEQLKATLKNHEDVVSRSNKEIRDQLVQINEKFCEWQEVVTQETGVYATLNRFKYTGSGETSEYVIAEGWIPASANSEVRQALESACRESGVGQLGATMEKSEPPHGASVPPTYYVVNKYTKAFQAIVESYGVARYREHNPTPYTIITFPFLFAVMFGDAGHGILLMALAIYFIVEEKKIGSGAINEMVQTPFDGRYVLFLMGFFAIYCGVLYNEVFGMPLNLYGGTRWHYGENATMAGGWKECYRNDANVGDLPMVFDDPNMFPGCNLPPQAPYPVGMDPIWKYSNGGLIFVNSLKMKMSVVFGVVQMVFGIIIKATNDIKHKRPLDIWCEFVPQMIFMNGIFGYMVVLIFVKWTTCWVPASQYLPGGELQANTLAAAVSTGNEYYKIPRPYCDPIENVNVLKTERGWMGYSAPPDIKQILINMFMHPADNNPTQFNLFAGMHTFHVMLVPLVVIMPLIMLLPKPLVLRSRAAAGTLEHDPADPHAGEDFEFGEVFIHQVIETIEFVLGAISNTASYLRLWALSLAHSQLTDVFFEKVLGQSLGIVKDQAISMEWGAVIMFFSFAIWLSVTFGVLMVMESLSAVLHALRLHWVEFQNKYYKGDGVKFAPFSFAESDVASD